MKFIYILDEGLANFVKRQIVNILVFAGHKVSVTTSQLYHCSHKQTEKICKLMSVAVFQ